MTSLDLWCSLQAGPEGAEEAATILNACPKLKELEVGGGDNLDDGIVAVICATQPALEQLILSNSDHLTDVPLGTIQERLAPTLRKLDLMYSLQKLSDDSEAYAVWSG